MGSTSCCIMSNTVRNDQDSHQVLDKNNDQNTLNIPIRIKNKLNKDYIAPKKQNCLQPIICIGQISDDEIDQSPLNENELKMVTASFVQVMDENKNQTQFDDFDHVMFSNVPEKNESSKVGTESLIVLVKENTYKVSTFIPSHMNQKMQEQKHNKLHESYDNSLLPSSRVTLVPEMAQIGTKQNNKCHNLTIFKLQQNEQGVRQDSKIMVKQQSLSIKNSKSAEPTKSLKNDQLKQNQTSNNDEQSQISQLTKKKGILKNKAFLQKNKAFGRSKSQFERDIQNDASSQYTVKSKKKKVKFDPKLDRLKNTNFYF